MNKTTVHARLNSKIKIKQSGVGKKTVRLGIKSGSVVKIRQRGRNVHR